MADYPAAVKTFTNPAKTDLQTSPSHAEQHGDANDEITAIQTTLGVNPQGAFDTVDERIINLKTTDIAEDIDARYVLDAEKVVIENTSNINTGDETSLSIRLKLLPFVIGDNIGSGVITGNELAANTITAANIYAGTITSNEIASGTITATQIAAHSITGQEIAADAIDSSHISSNTITADMIQADAITTTAIQAGAVTADQIQAGAINAQHISVSSLEAISANLGNVTSGTITAATLQTSADPTKNRVVIDQNGLYGWDDTLGNTFSIPTDGSAPTFANGTIISATIIDTTIISNDFRTSNNIPHIEITDAGVSLVTGAAGGVYDTDVYDTGVYGPGVAGTLAKTSKPFVDIETESTLADIRLYNRSTEPSGAADIGDVACVLGTLRLCTTAGTPGTYKTVATLGLSGTKTYYVADSSGGAVTRKLTFTDGILTAET